MLDIVTTSSNHVIHIFSLCFIALYFNSAFADPKQKNSTETQLRSNDAASFTHLDWNHFMLQPVTVLLTPSINRSAIPFENKDDAADDFEHGTIPQSVDSLLASLINSSGYLATGDDSSDFLIQLEIKHYQSPHAYDVDTSWWQELIGGAKRMVVSGGDTKISIALELQSNRKYIRSWKKEIKVVFAECELNENPQPLINNTSNNKLLSNYLHSSTGQAFVAASNYLLLQAIHFINSNGSFANVEKITENQLLLVSENDSFSIGEKLPIYYTNTNLKPSRLPVGRVQIIKTFDNQALAYPINISAKAIKIGDWVRMGQIREYPIPQSKFIPVNNCGNNHSNIGVSDAAR